MTLLLLLSALLSALTGAGSAARSPQLAVAVARQVEARAVQTAEDAVAVARPAVGLPGIVAVARDRRPADSPVDATPRYGERRRE